MTVEQIIAQVEAGGWLVWNIQSSTSGEWRVRLADPRFNGNARESFSGNSACWKVGEGASLREAMTAAAYDFLPQQQKDAIDLAKLIG